MTDFEKELLTLQIIMAKDAEEKFKKIVEISGSEFTTSASDEYLSTISIAIKHRLINIIHDYNSSIPLISFPTSNPIDRRLSTDDVEKFLEKFIVPLTILGEYDDLIKFIEKAESHPRFIKDLSDMADKSLDSEE